jgi:hypothetical protein
LQSPDSISHDRTTSNLAEPRPAARRSDSPVPTEEAGAALEGRSPTVDRNERLLVDSRRPLEVPMTGRPGRIGRFARETLKTAATLLILALAVLAALLSGTSMSPRPGRETAASACR